MTKLQLLHRALNERLMAAVEQIMEMVGGTVLEYEVETVRARKENEDLRRRLRWREAENPTGWPDNEINSSEMEQPVIINDTSGFEKPMIMDSPSINIEPVNVSDLQSLIPDARLAAAVSIRSADLKIVHPGTTKATNFGISNRMGWDSESYMAPLDCDPTVSVGSMGKKRIRSRTKRMSFACPDCGKVFGGKRSLLIHMRIHSADKPYECRKREACFYGDKKRKKKPRGICKVYPSKEIVEDKSDSRESNGPGTVSDPVENQKKKKGNEKTNKTIRNKKSQAHPKNPVPRINKTEAEQARAGGHSSFQCSECKKTFPRPALLANHLKSHILELSLAQKVQKKKQLLGNKPEKKVSKVSTQHPPKEKEISTDHSNVGIVDSKTGSELQATIVEPKQINLEPTSESKPEPKSQSNPESILESKSIGKGKKMKITTDVSSEIAEESTEDAEGIRRTYSCEECGKVYVKPGYLATHIKGHEAKRMQKKKERQEQKRLKWIIEKEAKINELAEAKKQNSINIRKDQDFDAQEVEIRGPFGQIKYKCRHCNKTFNRRNSLYMHMFFHLEEKVKDKPEESDVQESSPLEDSDSDGKEPAIESSDGNGGSPTPPTESTEPQSVCSTRKFSLLPQQTPASTISSIITNQAKTDSTFNSSITNHFMLQPRIVLQPLNVKSKTFTFPLKCDSVPTEPGAHVPLNSSQSDSLAKQQVAEAHQNCVTFSDADSEDNNDWSDVLHSLDEDISLHRTEPEKSVDMETADSSHPTSPQQESIPKTSKNHSVCDVPLSNRDEPVSTSVQDTGKHSGLTCEICGFKFAGNASLSQHMRIHTSEPARKSVNFKTSCSETKIQQPVVLEQTSEASTNFPEVSEEILTVKEEETSQSSEHHPDIDTSTRSEGDSETHYKSRKTKKNCKERKVLHCNFCGKACRKIELHLKYDHPREPEVIKALKRGQNSQERKRLLSSLCSLKVSESDEMEAALNQDPVHCLICQGSYRRNQFWKHALVCEQKKGQEGSEAGNSVCAAKHHPEPSSTVQKPDITNNSELEPSESPVSPSRHSTPVTTSHPQLTIADPQSDDPSSETSIIKSSCSPVQDCVQSEPTQQPQDKENDTSHASEENNAVNGEGTGSDLNLALQDSDCSTVLKRKSDSQDSMFTEAKTKKQRHSDPSQTKKLLDVPLELECLQKMDMDTNLNK